MKPADLRTLIHYQMLQADELISSTDTKRNPQLFQVLKAIRKNSIELEKREQTPWKI